MGDSGYIFKVEHTEFPGGLGESVKGREKSRMSFCLKDMEDTLVSSETGMASAGLEQTGRDQKRRPVYVELAFQCT